MRQNARFRRIASKRSSPLLSNDMCEFTGRASILLSVSSASFRFRRLHFTVSMCAVSQNTQTHSIPRTHDVYMVRFGLPFGFRHTTKSTHYAGHRAHQIMFQSFSRCFYADKAHCVALSGATDSMTLLLLVPFVLFMATMRACYMHDMDVLMDSCV